MDDVIKSIVDMDKKARDIVDEARTARHARDLTMRRMIDDYAEKVKASNLESVRDLKAQAEKEAEQGIRQFEESAKVKIAQMQKYAEDNKGEWIEKIYAKIIDGSI